MANKGWKISAKYWQVLKAMRYNECVDSTSDDCNSEKWKSVKVKEHTSEWVKESTASYSSEWVTETATCADSRKEQRSKSTTLPDQSCFMSQPACQEPLPCPSAPASSVKVFNRLDSLKFNPKHSLSGAEYSIKNKD